MTIARPRFSTQNYSVLRNTCAIIYKLKSALSPTEQTPHYHRLKNISIIISHPARSTPQNFTQFFATFADTSVHDDRIPIEKRVIRHIPRHNGLGPRLTKVGRTSSILRIWACGLNTLENHGWAAKNVIFRGYFFICTRITLKFTTIVHSNIGTMTTFYTTIQFSTIMVCGSIWQK